MATSGGPTTVRRITTTARHSPGSGLAVNPYGRLIAYGMRQLRAIGLLHAVHSCGLGTRHSQ